MLAVVAATSLGLPKTTSPNLNNLDAKISPVSVDGEEDYPDNAEGSPSSSSGDEVRSGRHWHRAISEHLPPTL